MPPTQYQSFASRKKNFITSPHFNKLTNKPPIDKVGEWCIYCGQKTPRLKNHYAHSFSCGQQASSDLAAEKELSQILLTRPELAETVNSYHDDNSEASLLPSDNICSHPVHKSTQGFSPSTIQDLRHISFGEAALHPYPLNVQRDSLSEDDAMDASASGSEIPAIPEDLHEPQKQYHIQEPNRYIPVGRTKLPPEYRAGQPTSEEKFKTSYAERFEEFRKKKQDPIYGPFTEGDWNFTRWVKRHQLSRAAVEDFLKMPDVSLKKFRHQPQKLISK